MRTVAANVQRLIGWNRSMAVALERAENGSQAEESYFIEKLEKTANALGFVLDTAPADVTVPTTKPEPERPSERAMRLSASPSSETLAQFLAEYIDRNEYKAQAGEVGALEEVIWEGITAYEKEEGVAVKVVIK